MGILRCRYFVLRVIGNDYTDEERQTDQCSDENKYVNKDGMFLQKRELNVEKRYDGFKDLPIPFDSWWYLEFRAILPARELRKEPTWHYQCNRSWSFVDSPYGSISVRQETKGLLRYSPYSWHQHHWIGTTDIHFRYVQCSPEGSVAQILKWTLAHRRQTRGGATYLFIVILVIIATR